MNDMTPFPFQPAPRNLLAEAIQAMGAVVSFDRGFGPKMYTVPSMPWGPELTEGQLVDVAIQAGTIAL